MSIDHYHYKAPSLIEQVTFEKPDGGAQRAYLHASAGADHAALQNIIHSLSEKGWQATPHTHDGKPALELRAYGSPPEVLDFVRKKGWTQGKPEITHTEQEKLGIVEKVKKRSLFASSLFYILGDVKFFTYGLKSSSPLDMAAGVFYGGGTASSMIGARRDPADLQVHDLAQQMADYMKSKHAELPQESALHEIVRDHKKGMLKTADDFVRRYPSELMNTFFGLAGVCIATAAYRNKVHAVPTAAAIEERLQYRLGQSRKFFPNASIPQADIDKLRHEVTHHLTKELRTEGWLDVGLGTMTASSGLFATLVKEKAHDPDAPPKHGLDAVWDWVQQRPLAVAGVGYMVSTLCHAASTVIAWQGGSSEAKKAIFDRGVFVATNLMAELLVAISSKGHGSGVKSDGSIDDTIISLAADMIVRQPAELQEALIPQLADFLGKPEVLGSKDAEIATKLRVEVEAMRKNPWSSPAHKAAEKATLAKPEGWKQRVQHQATQAPDLGLPV